MIIQNVKLIPKHPFCYRHKNFENDGVITNLFNIKPDENSEFRLCFEITYPDGFKDLVPVSNVLKGHNDMVSENMKKLDLTKKLK